MTLCGVLDNFSAIQTLRYISNANIRRVGGILHSINCRLILKEFFDGCMGISLPANRSILVVNRITVFSQEFLTTT